MRLLCLVLLVSQGAYAETHYMATSTPSFWLRSTLLTTRCRRLSRTQLMENSTPRPRRERSAPMVVFADVPMAPLRPRSCLAPPGRAVMAPRVLHQLPTAHAPTAAIARWSLVLAQAAD